MEIRVLRYFLAVVREESITKAAELLHITQPTLSRQIAQLEEEMGIKLFDRGTRKIVLTNEGILPRRLDVQSELARWFGDEFEKLNILMTANLPSNSSVMAHYKLAYAIIILGSISFWNPDKIVWRPLEPRLKASSVLAWRRKQPFGLAAEKFIKHVKEALRGGGEGI